MFSHSSSIICECSPHHKELGQGRAGYAEPGVLTALMGGSGAGKTTLMDVLAGRKTQGATTGDILVNGHPKEQETWVCPAELFMRQWVDCSV